MANRRGRRERRGMHDDLLCALCDLCGSLFFALRGTAFALRVRGRNKDMRKLMVVFAAVIAACSTDDRSSVVVDTVGGEVEAVEGQGSLIVTLAEGRLDSPVDTLSAGR